MAGGLRPPAWIERQPNHKRLWITLAFVIELFLDP